MHRPMTSRTARMTPGWIRRSLATTVLMAALDLHAVERDARWGARQSLEPPPRKGLHPGSRQVAHVGRANGPRDCDPDAARGRRSARHARASPTPTCDGAPPRTPFPYAREPPE